MHWNNFRTNTINSRYMITSISALLVIIGLIGSADAFPRKPLFEDFTSTTCPPCAALAPAQAAALAQLEENDEVVPIAYHMNWPAPGNDPWYHDNATDNNGKRGYYGVNGVPTLYLDGAVTNARSTAQIIDAVRARARTASPLDITLTGRIIGGELVTNIVVESDRAVNNVRLYIGMNELYFRYDAYAEWWDHYDAMVEMVPDYNGTAISVTPNEPYQHEFRQSMQGLGWHELDMENLKIVAWVQEANHNVLQAASFRLGIDSPAIEIVDWMITDDVEGDGDTRAEPGETAHFVFSMHNAENYLPAESVDATLTSHDADVEVVSAEFHMDVFENGAEADNSNSPFRIMVADDFVPHPVTFTLSITATPGDFMVEQEVTFMVGWPPFLLVDAANNQNAGDHLREAFGRSTVPWYDTWDRNVDGPMMDEELIEQYDVVLWHTFNSQNDAIIEYEADLLTQYLDNGGTLVMSSAYLPGQLGNHRLLTEYLGATVDQANAGGSVNFVKGIDGDRDFAGTNLFLGGPIGFPTARMSFRVSEDAEAVLRYEDAGHANRGVAAIKHEAGSYRTLLLGFPMETVCGTTRTDSLIFFTSRIWDWVENGPVSVSDDEIAPAHFALDPAYPNPFNAQTMINYSLATNGTASLKLFDIAGREVAVLFAGEAKAGHHTASLNAEKMGLESGIYYIRFEASGEKAVSQIVYLK